MIAVDCSWLVCHTRPRCEKKFAALMQAERFAHYLPLVESVRRYATQTKRFTKPLFTGYVFAQVPDDGRTRIYQQELLARAIQVKDEAKFLRQLEAVRALIASGYALSLRAQLTKGRLARIVGGALHGIEGIIEDDRHPKGIVISIDVLRQGLFVRLPADRLEPV